jgi:amidase
MKGSLLGLLMGLYSAVVASADADFSGRWEITTRYPGGQFSAGLNLREVSGSFEGRSAYLVPDGFFYRYRGSSEKGILHLKILAPDDKTVVGELNLTLHAGTLAGSGSIHEVPVTFSGHRPLERPKDAPRAIAFEPRVFYDTLSGTNAPALHIFPGDTVHTKTVDADGGGENAAQRSLPGNRQTGPFYIEGAMIGDTIAVHFNRIRPNRDTAFQARTRLNPAVLPPGYPQPFSDKWSNLWNLDREHNTARPAEPSDRLRDYEIKLVPMLGTVGVAPYWDQAFAAADLGPYGGNLDYNQVQEGTTLYLPVYQAGALLSMGDGHALQADGEITGQGLETSLDVEFTVDLIRDQLLDQPWIENDEFVMVSGVDGSLERALQQATAGLTNWLKSYYRLNIAEIATVLATSVHYDIAEVVDTKPHVVAKISKNALKQLAKPDPPAYMFCQARRGCDLSFEN